MQPSSVVFVQIMFGIVGLAYFSYGKKLGLLIPLISGVGLMFFPYFVSNDIGLLVVGFALVVLPFFVKV